MCICYLAINIQICDTQTKMGVCNSVSTIMFFLLCSAPLGTQTHSTIANDYLTHQGHGHVVQSVGKTPKMKKASKLEISFISMLFLLLKLIDFWANCPRFLHFCYAPLPYNSFSIGEIGFHVLMEWMPLSPPLPF